ncbi:MFS transporter [Fulvivirga kasyanovii]|uniref:MFS transporter n=1 Tax=Fulvivirga kasyanovii TaxID=396812 RepID=A0ABW9RWP3_9BACT|nr:MFS transporter [Fulvivirga kasyanovii]MTI28622.1 MFS transporter [Fulvivirga kasyanovii]
MTPIKRSRIAVSLIFFCYGLCFASWASRIPTIQQVLQLSEAELGGILFALPVGSLVSLPLSGFLVARFGSRPVVIVVALTYGLSLICIGLAPSVVLLIAALFMFGLIGNMLNISVNTQAVGVESAYNRNIMAKFHGMWSLAGFAGAGIGALMIALSISPPIHYTIIAVSILGVLFYSFRYLLPKDVNTDPDKPLFSLPDKSLMVLGVIAFFSMMCEGAMFDWSGVYFKKIVAVQEEWIGIGYTAFMIAMAGTRFVADTLVHRHGLKKVLMVSGSLTALGLTVAVIFPYFVPATIGLFIVGIGVSSVVPLVFSVAGKSKTQSPGVALASVSTLGFFGFLLGPPIIGLIAGASDLRVSFVFLAVIGAIVAILSGKGVK